MDDDLEEDLGTGGGETLLVVEETDVDRSRRRGDDLEGLRMLFGGERAVACLPNVGEGVLEPGVTVEFEEEFEGDEE